MHHAAKAPGGLGVTRPGDAPSRRGLGHNDKRDGTDRALGAWTQDADEATVVALVPLPIAALVGAETWAEAERAAGQQARKESPC